MQQIVHLPSNTKALFLGSHQGMKASLVRLESGQEQYWRNENTQILEEQDMTTNKIIMKLSGPKHNTWQVIERVFENVEDAAQYLGELTRWDEITNYSKGENTTATLSNGWTVTANFSIKKIMEKKQPKDLPDWFPFDLRKGQTVLNSSNTMPNSTTQPTAKKKLTGKVVKIQDLVKDTRKARVILRSLVNKKKITKPGRWEWEEGSNDLAVVKEAVKGL